MSTKEEITTIFKYIKEGKEGIDVAKLKIALDIIQKLFPGEEKIEIHKLVRDLKIFIKQNASVPIGGLLSAEKSFYKEVLEMLRDLADARCIEMEWDAETGELKIDN